MKEAPTELEQTLLQFQKSCCRQLKARSCTLALYDPLSKQFHGRVFPEKKEVPFPLKIQAGNGILGLCALQLKPINVPRLEKDARRLLGVDDLGNPKAVSLLAVPMQCNGKLIGIVGVHDKSGGRAFSQSDLSQLKKMAEEAATEIHQAQEKRAQLQQLRRDAIHNVISGLSNYLKHLLHGISTGAAVVDSAMKERNMENLKKGWHVVRQNEKRIANLVRDLVYLTGEKKATLIPTNITDLMRNVASTLRRTANEKNILMKLDIREGIPEMPADPIGFHRALHHLLSNALDSIEKKGGKVTVNVYPQPPYLLIEMQDTGKGIPPENLQRIFEPFFSTKEHRGIGIGLSVTQKVMEEHGGEIEVSSTLGKGTLFVLKLPLLAAVKTKLKKKSKK